MTVFFQQDAVGTFLLEMCNSSKEVWIIAEAVDALMDLYAEDETDASAARINLVQRLQIGAPVLKTMVNFYYSYAIENCC